MTDISAKCKKCGMFINHWDFSHNCMCPNEGQSNSRTRENIKAGMNEKQKDDNGGYIKELEENIKRLQRDNYDLKKEVDVKKNLLRHISGTVVEELKEENRGYRQEITVKTGIICKMNEDMGKLLSEAGGLKGKIKEQENTVQVLNAENEKLKIICIKENKHLREEVKRLQSTIDIITIPMLLNPEKAEKINLLKENEKLKERIEELMAEVCELREEVGITAGEDLDEGTVIFITGGKAYDYFKLEESINNGKR